MVVVYRRSTTIVLVLLGLLCVPLAFLRLHPSALRPEAEAWLARHRPAAERVVREALDRKREGSFDPPPEIPCEEAEAFDGAVSFLLRRGGFKGLDGGVCYSASGTPPPLGLGRDPPAVWERLDGDWFVWEAE